MNSKTPLKQESTGEDNGYENAHGFYYTKEL